jgi:HNH endonuclease
MKCIVCLDERMSHTPEHIVPAALGGSLTTDAFCARCNERIGREVDAPFSRDHWMVELGARYAIKDRYGRVPAPPRIAATVEGKPAVVTMGTPWTVETFPETRIEGDRFTFTVPADREEEIVAKKLARLSAQFGEVEVASRQVMPNDAPVVQFEEVWPIERWPRFAAKVTLGIASLLPGSWEWRASEQGQYIAETALQEFREPRDAEVGLRPLPLVLQGDDLFARLVPPPRHFISIDESGIFITIILFGRYLCGAALGDEAPGRGVAWLFDPLARTVQAAPYLDLLMRLVGEMDH